MALSDDFNPVEYSDAGDREQTRRRLAMFVRSR
jgi:hypothetical protein